MPDPVPTPLTLAQVLRRVANVVEGAPVDRVSVSVHPSGSAFANSYSTAGIAFVTALPGAVVGQWYGRSDGERQREIVATVDGVRWCAVETEREYLERLGLPDEARCL